VARAHRNGWRPRCGCSVPCWRTDEDRVPSNKLAYVVKELGVGEKLSGIGTEAWVACMNGDPKAWAKMKRYSMRDVAILEPLHVRLINTGCRN